MTTTLNTTVASELLAPCCRGRQSLKESCWYSGWLLTFLAIGDDTQGRFALIEATTRRGNVPNPHIHHREDETFYVLEGEITATIGVRRLKGTAGSRIFAPRGVPHSLETQSDSVLQCGSPIVRAGTAGGIGEAQTPTRCRKRLKSS